jgi:transposase
MQLSYKAEVTIGMRGRSRRFSRSLRAVSTRVELIIADFGEPDFGRHAHFQRERVWVMMECGLIGRKAIDFFSARVGRLPSRAYEHPERSIGARAFETSFHVSQP